MKTLAFLFILSFLPFFLLAQFGLNQPILQDRAFGVIVFADIDNDDDADVLVSSTPSNGKLLGWYENLGNSGDFIGYKGISTGFTSISSAHVIDLNGDGMNDILICSDPLYWKPGLGSGQFGEENTILTSAASTQSLVIPLDWDGDSDLDVLYQVGNKILGWKMMAPAILGTSIPHPGNSIRLPSPICRH
ncbi:MAG: VCBS repeat-containing protein [Saprospirales bacterium]|nr:VCBS repeat-containing protein [Saprospirales bacterium]